MDDQNTIKLLLVDDEEKFLQSVAKRLALKGFDVATAGDGDQAMAEVEKSLFDVALVDLQMPGMNGAKLLEKLKERHKYLEIIMLTGHGSVDSAVACTRLGAFNYIEKPFDFDRLIEVIRDAYEERMKKKFEHNIKRIEEIQKLSVRESPLGLLKALAKMDNAQK